jgi:hypothetical protein
VGTGGRGDSAPDAGLRRLSGSRSELGLVPVLHNRGLAPDCPQPCQGPGVATGTRADSGDGELLGIPRGLGGSPARRGVCGVLIGRAFAVPAVWRLAGGPASPGRADSRTARPAPDLRRGELRRRRQGRAAGAQGAGATGSGPSVGSVAGSQLLRDTEQGPEPFRSGDPRPGTVSAGTDPRPRPRPSASCRTRVPAGHQSRRDRGLGATTPAGRADSRGPGGAVGSSPFRQPQWRVRRRLPSIARRGGDRCRRHHHDGGDGR